VAGRPPRWGGAGAAHHSSESANVRNDFGHVHGLYSSAHGARGSTRVRSESITRAVLSVGTVCPMVPHRSVLTLCACAARSDGHGRGPC
jgi:hypothetical protein